MSVFVVDPEELLVSLYPAVMPGFHVAVEADVDQVTDDEMPALLVNARNGRMISNGSPRLGWTWDIYLTLLVEGLAAAADSAKRLYLTTHGFHDTQAGAGGPLGYVSSVEDISLPSRTARTALTERRFIYQYSGAFRMTFRPPAQ